MKIFCKFVLLGNRKNEFQYVIYNKKNGEEIARNPDKASLYIYEIDPDYNTGIFDTGEIVE